MSNVKSRKLYKHGPINFRTRVYRKSHNQTMATLYQRSQTLTKSNLRLNFVSGCCMEGSSLRYLVIEHLHTFSEKSLLKAKQTLYFRAQIMFVNSLYSYRGYVIGRSVASANRVFFSREVKQIQCIRFARIRVTVEIHHRQSRDCSGVFSTTPAVSTNTLSHIRNTVVTARLDKLTCPYHIKINSDVQIVVIVVPTVYVTQPMSGAYAIRPMATDCMLPVPAVPCICHVQRCQRFLKKIRTEFRIFFTKIRTKSGPICSMFWGILKLKAAIYLEWAA